MNFVQEKDSKICIAHHQNNILGKKAEYSLWQCDMGEYMIRVKYEVEDTGLCMFCDFFNAAELYGKIVKTNTLPENLVDIYADMAFDGILSKLI